MAFKCVYCKKGFSSASNRTRHMKTTHKKNSRGEEVPITKFMCVFCDKAYTTKSSFLHHLDSVHLLKINKIFKCDRPNCSYKSDHKGILNRHIRRVHRPRPNYTEKQKIKCGKCPSAFISRSSLWRHEKKFHKDIRPICPSNIKRKCPLCPFYSTEKTKKEIIEHFDKDHSLNISTEKHSFADLEKFNEWKDQLQTNTSATFVKASYSQPRSLHFICHRRGYFKTKGHNKRQIKMSGSCKINAYCPCEIHAKINQNGSVSVVYYPTHVGHENDLKFMRLPAADKMVIVSQLLSKTPHEEILDRLRWTPSTNNEPQRIHLVNKKDLRNIERSLNIKSEEMRHKFDPVSVEAWVNELKTNQNTALIVYKPQGLPAYPRLEEDDQSNNICKDDLEILWKQLLEATSTNEEINLVKETLKETIGTVNAMKTSPINHLWVQLE